MTPGGSSTSSSRRWGAVAPPGGRQGQAPGGPGSSLRLDVVPARRRPGQLGNRQPQQRPHRLARRRTSLPRRQRGSTAHPSLRGPAKQALEQPRHRGCPPGGKGLAGGRADGGEDAVQDAEDAGGGPPDQPPGLRRPGLLAAGRPGARLATRPTPTGTPKDPPRRRVTASLAHQNRGSGPGWRTPVRRVSQPPEAAKPLPGALGARFPLVHAHPYTTRFLSHSVTPQNSTRVFTITKVVRKCARKRLCSLPRPRPAAHWAFPSAPAVRHACARRCATPLGGGSRFPKP